MSKLILVINTGGTSTKVGLFKDCEPVFVENIRHSDEELAQFEDIISQKDYREQAVLELLKNKDVKLKDLSAVSARGGLLRPLESGTYQAVDKMLQDLKEAKRGTHASHLSALIGSSIADAAGIACFVVDPVSVDEFDPIARYTGHKLFKREMLTHALNMKAVAKRYAKENNLDYYEMTLIVIHLGTGISVSIHKDGRMVDAINPSEEGTFSLDRSGSLPILQVARYIIENKLDYKTFEKMVFGDGGIYSYFGTKDFKKVTEKYKAGDRETIDIVDAMAYQVAKDVGGLATVNYGKVDCILITGGMAYQEYFVNMIIDRIKFIAPVKIYPGEDEMQALAEGTYRVLIGEETPEMY
ncbi:MAG TPA: butyrate kinase [Candidatus Kapabacteria bacterium]|nr:butyrate kinase [Candidatus Kapabacteria bacterium]